MADVVFTLGGIGTQVGVTTYAGCFSKALWASYLDSTITIDKLMGTNGEALFSGNGLILDNGDGTGVITDAGNISATSLESGMYITLTNANPSARPDGIFLVISNDLNSITFNTTDLNSAASVATGDTMDYYVGGSGDIRANTGGNTDLQDQFDSIRGLALDGTNNHNGDLYINRDCDIDTTVDIEFSGSTTTRVRAFGVDSTFDIATDITIQATAAIAADGVFNIGVGGSSLEFHNIVLDANDNALNALKIQDNTSNGTGTSWYDCSFLNATGDNIANDGGGIFTYALRLFNPTITGATGAGIGTVSSNDNFVKCFGGEISGNGLSGVELSAVQCVLSGVSIHSNGVGITLDSFASTLTIDNCTIADNTGAGIAFDGTGTSTVGVDIINTSITGNSVDFLPSGSDYSQWNIVNCCLNNDSTYTPLFSNMVQYNIVTDAPQYTNAPTDYTPLSTSPLNNAGVSGTGDTIGALCATAGGGGGVMKLTGLLS